MTAQVNSTVAVWSVILPGAPAAFLFAPAQTKVIKQRSKKAWRQSRNLASESTWKTVSLMRKKLFTEVEHSLLSDVQSLASLIVCPAWFEDRLNN